VGKVNTTEALAILTSLSSSISELASETGTRGEVAHLRVTKGNGKNYWAVVTTPGDRWFSLEVNGGYINTYFEEDTPLEEAKRRLERLTAAAVQYVTDEPSPTPYGALKMPAIILRDDEGPLILRKSLGDAVKSLYRRNRWE
jgi:hypothetical protein